MFFCFEYMYFYQRLIEQFKRCVTKKWYEVHDWGYEMQKSKAAPCRLLYILLAKTRKREEGEIRILGFSEWVG